MAHETTTYALWNKVISGQRNGPEVEVVDGHIVSVCYYASGILVWEVKLDSNGTPIYSALGKSHRLNEQPRT